MKLLCVLIFVCGTAISQQSLVMKFTPIALHKNDDVDWVYTSLLTTFNTLNVADVFITRRGIERGAYEFNPIMRGALDNPPWDLMIKVAMMSGINFLLKLQKEESPLVAYIIVGILIVTYTIVNVHNYNILMSF